MALDVVAHLSTEELGQRYRAAHDPVERTHLQVIWLRARGKSRGEVMEVTGYSRRWVIEIERRYRAEGPAGLGDRRRSNAGAPALLRPGDEAGLAAALEEPPPDGGLWTGPKVAAWMSERLGRRIWPQRGWDYLVKLERSLQVPRPRHERAAGPAEQDAFKKAAGRQGRSPPAGEPRGAD